MRTGTVKGSLQLFGIIAVGTTLFGLWQGYGIGETLIAAILSAWHRPGWSRTRSVITLIQTNIRKLS
jgi:hypothetical protein